MSLKREVRDLLELARRAGCDVRLGGDDHWKIVCPGGQRLTCSQTPSDWRAVENLKAALRRAGVLERPVKGGRRLTTLEREFLERFEGEGPLDVEDAVPPRLVERGLVRVARRRRRGWAGWRAWLTPEGKDALR